MAVTITATPEASEGRIAIKAEGGTIGDAFYIGRRGRDGILGLVRETSEASRIWERDPAGARTNLFTRPRFEAQGSAQTVHTNLFRNAAFVLDETQNNVVRTNLAPNPGFEENNRVANQWGGGDGVTDLRTDSAFSGAGYLRARWTKAGTWGGIWTNTFNVVPGREYSVSVYVRSNAVKRFRISVRYNGVSAPDSIGPEATVRPYNATTNKGWTRLTWTGKAPAGAVSAFSMVYLKEGVGQKWNVGDWMDIDAMLVEEGKTIGEFFDGSSGDQEDPVNGRLVAGWTGTFNNSSSVLYPARVYGVTGEQSVIRAYSGGALILPSGTSNASAAVLDHGGQMQPGKTYTISAILEVLQRNGTVHPHAGRITVTSLAGSTVLQEDKTGLGTDVNGNPVDLGGAALLSAQTHRLTVTIPSGATSVIVRVWNGASQNNGRLAFRSVRIHEGDTDLGTWTGNTGAGDEFDYGFTTPLLSNSVAIPGTGSSVRTVIPPAGGFLSSGAVAISSTKWRKNGSRSMRLWPTSSDNNSYVTAPTGVVSLAAGKTYTFLGVQRLTAALTGDLHPDSRRVRVTGTGMNPLVSTQPANTANRQTQFRWQFTVPAGATNVRMEFVHGGALGSGDFYWDEVLVVEGKYTGNYFDGEVPLPAQGGWNGARDASTSIRYSESLSITVHDYEARQGQDMEYFVLDSQGYPVGDGALVSVPEWGTWLKDPFRPHLNARLHFNSDESYTRSANRVLLQPRGSRLPIAQWERRTAPEGKIRLLTETPDEARRLTALVDEAGVVFLDVAEEFGVPFQYVSLGDVSGVRAVAEALRAPQRYWDIDMQEVAMPIGEPSGMSATYENLMSTFASYLELRNSVKDYASVASGEWQ